MIDRAEQEIDFAAYALTDWPVMQALTRAADRGVNVRIYLKYVIRGEAISRQSQDHGLGSMMVEGRIWLVPVFSIARERLDGRHAAEVVRRSEAARDTTHVIGIDRGLAASVRGAVSPGQEKLLGPAWAVP